MGGTAAECSEIFFGLPFALKISAKMTPLILMLACFLVAVHGVAYPAPTLAARLEKRQGGNVQTVWSPTVIGTSVSCRLSR